MDYFCHFLVIGFYLPPTIERRVINIYNFTIINKLFAYNILLPGNKPEILMTRLAIIGAKKFVQ